MEKSQADLTTERFGQPRLSRAALVLASVITLVALAGCGESADGSAVTATATSEVATTSTAVAHPALNEEYVVYNALLQDGGLTQELSIHTTGSRLIVIRTPTEVFVPDLWAEVVPGMRRLYPDLGEELYTDFGAKNAEPADLERLFALDADYVVANVDALFASGAVGWADFYAKYPDADGLLTLSRVGFDQGMQSALVCVSYYQGGLSGMGRYVLLKKEGGRWVVRGGYGAWIS